jgi:hypothetical protein
MIVVTLSGRCLGMRAAWRSFSSELTARPSEDTLYDHGIVFDSPGLKRNSNSFPLA